MPNGNGSAVRPARAEADEPDENIFLFYPNLIGTMPYPALQIHALTVPLQVTPALSSP